MTAAAEVMENLWCLCSDLLMYTVASPDTNPRGGGQLPNLRVQFYAYECNEGRDANP